MSKSRKTSEKPLVGFFPRFYGMGETYPLIQIAKRYQELGGKVVFFSHGGEYEYLAEEIGCKPIRIKPLVRSTTKYLLQQNENNLIKIIESEALSYKKAKIEALVQTNVFFGCILAARVARIPLISVVSGTWIPPYIKANPESFPDAKENAFTRLIPQDLKNRIFNWYARGYKDPVTKKMNRLAKDLNVDLYFKCKIDLLLGDYTLVGDDIDFLGLKPTKEFPAQNYIGPILPYNPQVKKPNQFDDDVEAHLKRPGKHILLTMGSSLQWKNFFEKILKILNQTNYNFIVTYTTILEESELPPVNENILLKKFIPNIANLHKLVDLSIIHGGRGTVHAVAYSGKPSIGIPLHGEQQSNIDTLVHNRVAIKLSKTFFKEKHILDAITEIFDNYDIYYKNAQNLAKKLPKPEGDKNAARRIVEILQQNHQP